MVYFSNFNLNEICYKAWKMSWVLCDVQNYAYNKAVYTISWRMLLCAVLIAVLM